MNTAEYAWNESKAKHQPQHNPRYNQHTILCGQKLISIAQDFDQPMTKYDEITIWPTDKIWTKPGFRML